MNQSIHKQLKTMRIFWFFYVLGKSRHSGSYPICIDTGTSCCISNDHSHFVLLDLIENVKVTRIASGLAVKGMGIVKWIFMDDRGQVIELPIKDCLYIPNVLMCLLSPQQVAQQMKCKGDGFHALAKNGIFTFNGYTTSMPYNRCS